MSKLYVDEIHPKTSGKHVVMPEKPAFSVSMSATGASGDYTSTNTDVPFDTIDFNIGNCVAISSNVATFTAPVGGIYQLNSMIQLQNATGAGWTQTVWYKNGSTFGSDDNFSYRVLFDPQGGSYTPIMQSQAVQLAANDAVKVMFRINADTSVEVRLNSVFSGYLVG